MPKDEAGFPGYYPQTRVISIVVRWIGPVLALCLLAIFLPFLGVHPAIQWLVAIAILAVMLVRKRLENTIDQKVYSWRTGRNAEWEVREALANGLSDDFYLLNDIVLPGMSGNIDHVVVGPSGVHLIETKGDYGNVDATGDTLRIRNYPSGKYTAICRARRESLRRFLSDRLPGESRTYPIHPIIVFTRASEVRSYGATDDVYVEDIDGMVQLILRYSEHKRIDEMHRAQVFRALRTQVASRGKKLVPAIGM